MLFQRWLCCLGLPVALATGTATRAESLPPLRPPSVPLVTCDPYFSLWSPGDNLAEVDTTHWTGKPQRLGGQVVIDGNPFRIMGSERTVSGPALPQVGLEVLPTRSIYSFAGEGIALKVIFLTPALPDDLEVLARPVTYVIFDAVSTDHKPHQVQATVTASAEIAVNTPDQLATATKVSGMNGLAVLRAGSVEQAVLAKPGDDLRIDWGYLYVAAPQSMVKETVIRMAPDLAPHAAAGIGAANPAGSLTLAMTLNLGRSPQSQPASGCSWLTMTSIPFST